MYSYMWLVYFVTLHPCVFCCKTHAHTHTLSVYNNIINNNKSESWCSAAYSAFYKRVQYVYNQMVITLASILWGDLICGFTASAMSSLRPPIENPRRSTEEILSVTGKSCRKFRKKKRRTLINHSALRSPAVVFQPFKKQEHTHAQHTTHISFIFSHKTKCQNTAHKYLKVRVPPLKA